jgi:lipooligosaccharide transport system permease protein
VSTPAAVRVWEGHLTQYRRVWRSNVMGAFVQPFLYLLGMGLGVGALVDRGDQSAQLLDGLTYLQFLAPGLIATSAMTVTSGEAMWPVLGGFKWWRGYHAAAATPVTPGQIAAGVALWHWTKALIVATGVATSLLLFDETRTWRLVLAVVFAGLTGIASSAPLAAWSASRESENSFPTINRLVLTPLFLFAGAFYPIDQLPEWLQWVARATPLWHGVELCRDAVNDRLELGMVALHLAYLTLFVVGGWLLARRSFARRLAG